MLKVAYKTITSEYITTLPEDLSLTKNFTLSELANKAGNPAKAQYIISEYSMSFNDMFQKFRESYKAAIQPTSGYRQPEYNKQIGGDPTSLHLQACAVDFIDKNKKQDYWMLSTWLRIVRDAGTVGAANIYNNNGLYRYHFEAFSNVFKGYSASQIRVYTTKDHYAKLAAMYVPMGIEVKYYGN